MSHAVQRFLFTLLIVAAGAAGVHAGSREEMQQLAQDLRSLSDRVGRLEQGLADTQRALDLLSSRVEALSRSAQTADLRADLDQIRRQVEVLSTQLEALKAKSELPPSPVLVPPVTSQPPAMNAPLDGVSAAPGRTIPGVAATESLYDQAYGDYLQGRYDLARDQFERFLTAYPQDPRMANARYWIGECHYSQKHYPEALAAFQDVLKNHPLSAKANGARLKLGLTHLAQGETAQGVEALKTLIKLAPESEEAKIAQERIKKLQSP